MNDKRIEELVNLVIKLVGKGYSAEGSFKRIKECLQISDDQLSRVKNWYNAGLITT